MIGIYQILHKESGKRYIGSSINTYQRIAHHKSSLKYGKHANNYLQKAWNKYGEESFEIKEILECEEKDLEFYEQLIIDGYKTNQRDFGFNLRPVSKSNKGLPSKRNIYYPGEKYYRLTLIKPLDIRNGNRWWLCKCDCGVIKELNPHSMKYKRTKSCGCYRREFKNIPKEQRLGA